MSEIQVNGEWILFEATTLGELLEALGRTGDGSGLAVAVNGHVVRRRDWNEHELSAGDEVEIVGAVQGG